MKKKPTKQERLADNLEKVLKQFMLGKSYKPMKEKELLEKLQLKEEQLPALRKALAKLVSSGKIETRDDKFRAPRDKNEVVTGVIHMNRRGFGFVEPEKNSPFTQDIFIPKHLTMSAVEGDTVEVVVNLETVSEKGPEGKVLSILERARSHVGGIVREIGRGGEIFVHVPLFGREGKGILEDSEGGNYKVGDRLVMEVLEWSTPATLRPVQLIGHISDPTTDVPAAIEEFGLSERFPVPVLNQAREYPKQVGAKEIEDREDLRDQMCCTIDPDTAKDFDDAVYVEKDKKGHYHLWVHIADVSYYVEPGSPIDVEAVKRCNSTYFPGTVVPMLPEILSNNLCSLKPNVNRLAASVLMELDPEGNMVRHRWTRSVIKSRKRFTYREAKEVIDGTKKSPHKKQLDLMVELCAVLKKVRHKRGSIEFSLPELVVLVDEKGAPSGTDYVEYDITHQMIEEFMLRANETIASDLSAKGKNLAYRVHDEPAEENLREFATLARAFGYDVSDNPTVRELQELFEEAQTTPYGPYLATNFIRRLRMATYSAENIGHYGLALTHYCHFTSPIRRYADLVVHRVLFGEDDDLERIEMIASRVSDQERVSAKAENSVVLLKKLRLLEQWSQEEPERQYEGVVTRVVPFGFFFEVLDLMIEGFIHVADIDNDFYVYSEAEMRLKGKSNQVSYTPGKKIVLMLQNIDLIILDTSWYLIPEKGEEKPKKEGTTVKRWFKEKQKKGKRRKK